ncbi:MAG: tetratricopeptide repeat protein, partial [Phycisphaerae bacterium]
KKFIRRHCIVSMSVAAALLAFVGFLVFASVKNEKIRAEQERSRATSAFLSEMLSAAKPGKQGADATVIELLADARRRVDTDLAESPRAAADILFTIGSTYRSLWHWQEATEPLERALELVRASYTPPHEEIARTLAELGTVYTSRRDARAVPIQREALAMRRALSGENDPLTALYEKNLGYALYQVEREFREAEVHLQNAVTLYRALYHEPHRDLGSCLHNFAYLYVTERRYPQADALFAEAVSAFRALNDPDEPYYAECLYGYSFLLAAREKWPEAIAITREAIPLVGKHFGQERTLPLLGILSQVEAEGGDCLAALATNLRGFDAVCGQLTAMDGGAIGAHAVVEAWIARGGTDLAEVADAIDAMPDAAGRRLLNQLENRATLLEICGEDEVAAWIWRRVIDHASLHDVASHPLLVQSHEGLGKIAQRAGRLAEAEEWFRSALRYADAASRVHPPTRLRVLGRLALCLHAAGKTNEARELADTALSALEEMHSQNLRLIAALHEVLGS